jgi:signal transduction histidine kinase
MFKTSKLFLVALAIWLCAGAAFAKDLVVDRAIFEDTTNALDLAQVQDAAFKPALKVINEGYKRSTFWIRLSVDVPVGSGPLSLRIRPTLLDSVTLYYPEVAGGDPELALDMGARSAQKDTQIELQPGLNTVFLRAKSIGVLLIKTEVLTQDTAMEQDFDEVLELGAVLSIYAVMGVLSLGLIWIRRDGLSVFIFFHLQVCVVLYFLLFGFVDYWVAADWLQGKTAARLTVILNFLSFLLWMQSVHGHFGWMRLQQWTRFAAAVFVLLIALFFVVDQHLVLKWSALFGSFMILLLMGVLFIFSLGIIKNKNIPVIGRLVLCLLFFAFFLFVCRSMLEVLGVIEGGEFLLRSPAWRGAFVPLAILGIQWQHDRSQSQKLLQQKIEKAVSEAQMKEQNKRMATQAQFLAMLMHEVKTPLSIIQFAVASMMRNRPASSADAQRLDNIARAADDLNFIIDQCMEAEKVEQSDVPAKKAPVELRSLISEMKQIPGYERVTMTGMEPAMVLTDFQYARIILSNLVTNALKYSLPESSVKLTVEPVQLGSTSGMNLRVSNTIGSAGRPDPLQVFTRYYRAEGAKKQMGAGLGLWLAHQLATKLGTELRCICDDEWVHFEFTLERP